MTTHSDGERPNWNVEPSAKLLENWPIKDVLTRLAEAATHLLSDHDCDAHGYEGLQHAVVAARAHADLLDRSAAGGDVRVLGEIRERVADGYESASSRNVITVAALALKDLHYVLSSHDGQYARGATRMREVCVVKVRRLKEIHQPPTNSFKQKIWDDIIRALESLTLDQVEQEKRS